MADQDEVLDIEADDTQLDDVEAVADPASEPEVVAGSVVETAEATEATEATDATEPIDPVAEFKATLRAKPGEWFVVHSYACLLYTSPSPRDRTRSRMPSSA